VADRSMTLEALYATEVVREAFTHLFNCDESSFIFLDLDDGSDNDEAWKDNMDLLMFAKYYAGPSNPHFVKMVQVYDCKTHTHFNHEMKGWAEGVVSVDSELGTDTSTMLLSSGDQQQKHCICYICEVVSNPSVVSWSSVRMNSECLFNVAL
jgi:hypothetical protein